MRTLFEETATYGAAKPDREEYLALLMKCRDAMLEVVRLTGENVKLNQEITVLQSEVHRLKKLVDFLINVQSRGG